MQPIMSDTVLLQTYHNFPPEIKVAISSYIEFLAQNYPQTTNNKPAMRKFGIMKGGIKYMAPDFNEPLDDFKDYM